jgi:hypothetical protein
LSGRECLSGGNSCRDRIANVDAEERHRNCWYARRTPDLPDDPGSHTIIDGELIFCAHPMYWPVVRYEFDVRNCEDCDVFKSKGRRDAETQS